MDLFSLRGILKDGLAGFPCLSGTLPKGVGRQEKRFPCD